MKIQQLKTCEISKNNSNREVYSSTILPQEIRKALNRQCLTLHLKQLKKEQKKKNSKISRRKEVIKIRAEMNEKEMKKKSKD